MKIMFTEKSFLYKALSLIFFVLLFFEGTNPVQARADQIRGKLEVLSEAEDRILTPTFSSPPLERNPFSPPFTKEKPTKTKEKMTSRETKPPDDIRLTGIVNNKLGKSAIIEISGESYFVHQGDSITIVNRELKVVKILDSKVIIEEGNHFFVLTF